MSRMPGSGWGSRAGRIGARRVTADAVRVQPVPGRATACRRAHASTGCSGTPAPVPPAAVPGRHLGRRPADLVDLGLKAHAAEEIIARPADSTSKKLRPDTSAGVQAQAGRARFLAGPAGWLVAAGPSLLAAGLEVECPRPARTGLTWRRSGGLVRPSLPSPGASGQMPGAGRQVGGLGVPAKSGELPGAPRPPRWVMAPDPLPAPRRHAMSSHCSGAGRLARGIVAVDDLTGESCHGNDRPSRLLLPRRGGGGQRL